MLISVFAYTNIIHLLIDAVFLVHEMSTEPFNFYVEKVNAFFFDSSVHFLICSKRKTKWADFACLYAPLLYSNSSIYYLFFHSRYISAMEK